MKNIETLVKSLKKYNKAYRSGNPLVSDHEYDSLVENLKKLDPGNPFLQSVEPEKFSGKKEIRHPVPMLSTEKAYTEVELERFVNRVIKEADKINIKEITFKVTAKLDGLAGRALEMDPQHGMAYIVLGDLASAREQYDEAQGFYDLAREVDPYRLGVAYEQRVTALDAARHGHDHDHSDHP